MAGGNFVSQHKIRPGAYINIQSKHMDFVNSDKKGVVLLPLSLNFGPSHIIVKIESLSDIEKNFGQLSTDTLPIQEALKHAGCVLVYRLNSGTSSTFSLHDDFHITSNYTGEDSNLLSFSLDENIDTGDFSATTYFHNKLVSQDILPKDVVSFQNEYLQLEGNISSNQTLFLTGGTSKSATLKNYMDFLTLAQSLSFDALSITTKDVSIIETVLAFVKRMREEEGKKIIAVVPNYIGADYEGILSVANGVTLSDATVISTEIAAAFVAGASAGAQLNQSNTYLVYDSAIDVSPALTHSEIISHLEQGQIVFTKNQDRVVLEKDINTLTSFTPSKNQSFSKNRTIRVLDTLANDVKHLFHQSYIGKITNNKSGRNLFKGDLIRYLENLSSIGAIQNFNGTTDVTVEQGSQKDAITVSLGIQPTDSMEKLYMTILVG